MLYTTNIPQINNIPLKLLNDKIIVSFCKFLKHNQQFTYINITKQRIYK